MEIRKTKDGSETIWSETYQQTYHSVFGAVTESKHVFIEAGFNQIQADPVNIFEMGFGSGLNAILTLEEAKKKNIRVRYHSIELHPVSSGIVKQYRVDAELVNIFQHIHEMDWDREMEVTPWFTLMKIHGDLNLWNPEFSYHLVYFDAFSPESQPELWAQPVFEKIHKMLHPGGILTTYCAKGSVRRNMIAAGFQVERLSGPPGKREMLRGRKKCEC